MAGWDAEGGRTGAEQHGHDWHDWMEFQTLRVLARLAGLRLALPRHCRLSAPARLDRRTTLERIDRLTALERPDRLTAQTQYW